ncbi:MAG: hypothetical protein K2K23_08775, partial [Muribaculaceae bacterium]|nr:hypothetical protein [Muribaculaceae bacterium]
NKDVAVRTSPFYEDDNISDWRLPTESLMELFRDKIKVSKMRMYFISDVSANAGKENIPICCYLPYENFSMGVIDNDSPGYCFSDSSEKNNNTKSASVFYLNQNDVIRENFSSSSRNQQIITRLVRPLTNDELEYYKLNYLGYGSQLKLSLCHPDTYTSEGWLAK